MTDTGTDIVALVRGAYEAFARGDVPAVLALMDERIEWYEAEGNPFYPGHAWIGQQQVVDEVFARLTKAFDGFAIHPDRFLSDGDTVVMQGRYSATKAHATGGPVDVQMAHVWDVRDGKAVRFQQYVDTRAWAAALGEPSG